jgi:hypothetical protein
MTKKERAIKDFAKAMRRANVGYISQSILPVRMTINMQIAWADYIVACSEEATNGKS